MLLHIIQGKGTMNKAQCFISPTIKEVLVSEATLKEIPVSKHIATILENHVSSRYVVNGRPLCKLKIDAPNAKQMRNHWCDNEGDCDTCLMNKYYGDSDE